jgi:hypothetical protein
VSCFAERTAAQPIGVLRPEEPELRKTIEEGVRQSATFENLVNRLNRNRLVVYIRFDRCAGGVAACTRLVAPRDTTRQLLIVLDRFGRSPRDLTALLAHELQHALEIAEAPTVTDGASLERLYSTTGLHFREGYETEAAIRVGRAVTDELSKRRRP